MPSRKYSLSRLAELKIKLLRPFDATGYCQMDDDMPFYNNCTPLHRAAKTGKLELVKKVVDEIGATIWIQDGHGRFAFEVVPNKFKSKDLELYFCEIFTDYLELLDLQQVTGEQVVSSTSSSKFVDRVRRFVDNGWYNALKPS